MDPPGVLVHGGVLRNHVGQGERCVAAGDCKEYTKIQLIGYKQILSHIGMVQIKPLRPKKGFAEFQLRVE